MSGGAEMIASAVVQRIAGMLGDIAWERIELLWNFKEDVQEMERKMKYLEVALDYADKRSRGTDDALVQYWLKKYKSVSYDIEDTLDELKADAMIWKKSPFTVKLFCSSTNPLVLRITISKKMRNIRVKLDSIAEEYQKKFPLLLLPTRRGQDNNGNWRETFIGNRDESEMVGMEREKEDILTKLLQKDGDQDVSIIPIVGLGGMGKTMLAKFVYNLKESNIFDVKAWVHVSMNFELKKIATAIISQVEGTTSSDAASSQYLKSQLDCILRRKLFLIVLDDLWEDKIHNLEKLMEMLPSGKKGSKIIVTTRNEQVAHTLSRIHSYFHVVESIKLKGLSIDECWSIMKPRKLGHVQLADLVDIGKEIAQRCGGVPLVAKALGYVMQKNCTKEEWLEIKNSNILDIKDDDKGILKGLLLSYYHMPAHLKLCFMYFSIFPKSHDIDHDCLIQQWIALGFIQDTDGQQLQKIGTEYIDEFLGMSFLTVFTSHTVQAARIFKPTLKFHMHDMVHDLARHVAGDEFSYTNDAASGGSKRDKLNCHYYLLTNHNKTSLAYKAFPAKVRALHFRECEIMHLPKQAFSHTLWLRILDLSGCHLSELPRSTYKLKLLRYLDASNNPISSLPKSLNYLLNLQTLVLSNTSLKTLPINIGCLQKLQFFDLSGCTNFVELPSSFGNLSALLFLNLASCHELQVLPESFGDLNCLQFLSLLDCYSLKSLPESCSQLHDLTHLDLSDCHNLGKLPDCIGNLSKLVYLNVTSCSKFETLPESLCKLVALKHLNLSFCVKLDHLPSCIGDLRLQTLDLQGCCFLRDLPDSIFNMSTLKNVEEKFAFKIYSRVEELRKKLKLLESCTFDGGSSELWSMIVLLERAPFHELKINRLKNVKHLEQAEQAKLSNNSKLTSLLLQWGHDQVSLAEDAEMADKSVLEKLVPPRSLQHLALGQYMSIDFPSWMMDIPSYLPHLTTITLSRLKHCNQLPPFGCLPNLRALAMEEMSNLKNVGEEFYGDRRTCQKLRVIILNSMDNLEEWWTTRSSNEGGEILIPNLHFLCAMNCPKLKFVPYPPRSMAWYTSNSDHVWPEHGFGNLSSITSPFYLHMSSTFSSSEVWRRIQYLSSAEILEISVTMGLRTLPEAIRGFTSLRQITIGYCEDLVALPEWLGDLTCLREIRIGGCPKLSSLPESIRRLTDLKRLLITGCPELSQKCQGEDKDKIAHVPEKVFD